LTLKSHDKDAIREHAEDRLAVLEARRQEIEETDRVSILRDMSFLYDFAFFNYFEIPWFKKAWSGEVDGKMIWDDSSPYLLRIYLTDQRGDVEGETKEEAKKKAERLSPFLHYFFRGDHDRDIHNHPWTWAFSLILKSGYLEYLCNAADKTLGLKKRRPGRLNFIRESTFHRVELDKGNCWSLFIAGPKVDKPEGEGWGFMDQSTGRFESYNSREARLEREQQILSLH